jgi:hypothetical protein
MDCVYTLADTEQLVFWDSDWIRMRIIFTTITVLGHRIRIFCRGSCAYLSGYGTTCVLGLTLGFGPGSFLLQLLCWDRGLDYFVVDCVHTLADTEGLIL